MKRFIAIPAVIGGSGGGCVGSGSVLLIEGQAGTGLVVLLIGLTLLGFLAGGLFWIYRDAR